MRISGQPVFSQLSMERGQWPRHASAQGHASPGVTDPGHRRNGIWSTVGSPRLGQGYLAQGSTGPNQSDNRTHAPLAQSAERLHGKEKVYGSIP